MELGAFSVSLAVKDLAASRAFTDIRKVQRALKAAGVRLEMEADEATTGPASVVIQDPDGNQILFDQHV